MNQFIRAMPRSIFPITKTVIRENINVEKWKLWACCILGKIIMPLIAHAAILNLVETHQSTVIGKYVQSSGDFIGAADIERR